jgi:RP/EB family microtubule-associated protein
MYPGQVPMHKVNWGAKQNFEIVANYKVLQDCFTKLHIDKHIEVARLMGGRYMDNLEFMQWFKRFFEMSVTDLGDYDAKAQRSKGKGAASLKPSVNKTTKTAATRVATKIVQKENKEPAPKTAPAATMRNKSPQIPAKTESVSSLENDRLVAELKASNQQLTQNVENLKGEIAGLEKERDFYFEKLRDVEILLQELEDSGQGNETISSIFKILYATADGFEAVEEDVMHHSHVAKNTDVAIEEETY